jgi:outer membrane protein OmpA-like peptidoglycan-associated protein
MLRVEFGFGSSGLTSQAQRALDQVALALNDLRLQSRRFLVEGHTDVVGSEDSNMRLSQQRALSVATYLQQHGVRPNRLAVQGYGKTQLMSGIPPTDGRNRRVEIVPMR